MSFPVVLLISNIVQIPKMALNKIISPKRLNKFEIYMNMVAMHWGLYANCTQDLIIVQSAKNKD